jgi:uncharacterized protein (DUF1697 family)
MALVVFLRGVNVGGHRTFRPSVLVKQLEEYDVVNIGAAGTLVVRGSAGQEAIRAALRRQLPFETEIIICKGADLMSIASSDAFAKELSHPDVVRFVSVLAKSPRVLPSIPISLPPDGPWLVKIVAMENRFIFGQYRRHMKTIRYLGVLDRLFGVPVTTRNWNTVTAIIKVLKQSKSGSRLS